jgi:hemoglobin
MIVEYIRYKIENERQKEFENAYEKAGKSLEVSPHCLQYELSHCVEEPNNYILGLNGIRKTAILKDFVQVQNFRYSLRLSGPFLTI